MKGSQQKGQGSKGLTKGKNFKLGWEFGYVAHKINECFYHSILMHMLNRISKRIKASPRDVIMEETLIKEKCETKNDKLVFKAQNLTGSSTIVKLA